MRNCKTFFHDDDEGELMSANWLTALCINQKCHAHRGTHLTPLNCKFSRNFRSPRGVCVMPWNSIKHKSLIGNVSLLRFAALRQKTEQLSSPEIEICIRIPAGTSHDLSRRENFMQISSSSSRLLLVLCNFILLHRTAGRNSSSEHFHESLGHRGTHVEQMRSGANRKSNFL